MSNHKIPYIDRDISWLHFNHRILQEAWRKEVPILERVNFLGIYSNNLDEFFRVRMAALSRIAEMRSREMIAERRQAAELIQNITEIGTSLVKEYSECIREVKKDLAANNIHLVDETELTSEQQHFVRTIFREKISGFISPIALPKITEFSKENDSIIYLAVELRKNSSKPDYMIISLPSAQCGRFISLPSSDDHTYVMYIDDIVRFCLPLIFPGMGYTSYKAYSFKFTKDAEMDIDNDLHGGPVDKIAKAVKNRKKGDALRVLFDSSMPKDLMRVLTKKLKLGKLDTVITSGRYQNHKDLMGFPAGNRSDLKYPAWPQIVPTELKQPISLLDHIKEKDRFIHVPYHTFDYVIRVLQEAAVSKKVKSIHITLYRLARNSKIAEALKCAARNGKKVTAVVELLARFDESSNISYAREMQDAGVNVVFGVEGLKIHSKICLITMKKGPGIAIVGTGNFHEGNAKVYTDYFMLTANPKIVDEVARVFDVIHKPYALQHFQHLLVSPFNMREKFLNLINDEILAAKKGKEAWIKIKINHITDEEMVRALYKASQAGVKVELVIRGNCSVVPGVPRISDRIEGAAIIDRYLEHSRIFIFCAGGDPKVYMGSADWMPRNLDRRIEVVSRIFDKDLKADLIRTVEYGLRDNEKARSVDGIGRNAFREIIGETEPFRSQERLYMEYANKPVEETKSDKV